MQNAYFCNNVDDLIKTFLKYGSKDEFVKISEYLDAFQICPPIKQEFSELLNLLNEITFRSKDEEKIENARKLNKEHKRLVKKQFS